MVEVFMSASRVSRMTITHAVRASWVICSVSASNDMHFLLDAPASAM